jgi:hypothetical protein
MNAIHAMPASAASDPAVVAELMERIWGFMASQALHAAASLEVFDRLEARAGSAGELAAACGAQEEALERLLGFLTSLGLLRQGADGRYALTERGGYLRADHPSSLHGLALLYGRPLFWQPWGNLLQTVQGGQPAFDAIHGTGLFDYLDGRTADTSAFHAAMAAGSRLSLQAILQAYDFSACRKIVEVGGGTGTLLRGILERYPAATGVLCDLPSVVAAADRGQMPERMKWAGSDMFAAIPEGGDTYIYKRIVHDWDDLDVIRMLRVCRRAIDPHGRLLIIESVLKPAGQADPARWMDLNMLVMLRGKERTEEAYRRLFEAAGFALTRVLAAGRESIVEGRPLVA